MNQEQSDFDTLVTTMTNALEAFKAKYLAGGTTSTSSTTTTLPPGPAQGTSVTDAQGNVYSISTNGKVYENGTTLVGFTDKVTLLVYANNKVYQENVSNDWWYWDGTNWIAATDPRATSTSASSSTTSSTSTTTTVPPTSGSQFGFASNAFSVTLNSAQRAAWATDFFSLGAKWVRFDCVWSEMEPSAGSYNFYLDSAVSDAIANGLKVLLILDSPSGVPSWAQSGGGMPNTAATAAAFGVFAGAVAAHYIPKGVLAYEIWNEPNGGNWTVAPAIYVDMLKAAYTAIKSLTNGNNTAVLGGGGVCPGGAMTGYQYIQALYQNGMHGYFDALSWHPYVYNDTPYGEDPAAYTGDPSWSGMLNAVGLMAQNGDSSKKIWCTEFGAPSSILSEAQQASQLAAAIKDWKSYAWAGNFFLYTYLTNDITSGGNESFFGIVHNSSHDGVTASGNKPAYAAIKVAINA